MRVIYVDADACPVKNEIYRVAERVGFEVQVVSNSGLRVPTSPTIHQVVVPKEEFDGADNWIAERIGPGDICVTADVPLADRCVKAGGVAVTPKGKVFDAASVGAQLATRNLLTSLREAGTITSGPPPMSKRDRSNFLQAMDQLATRIQREPRPAD